jgi:predicted nucleotidyltransferase
MDAGPMLARIASKLQEQGLEAILIGNAAAALHGAPVTTVDFDFLFRATPANVRKLKALAAQLGAVILRPFYPASGMFRLMRDDDGLQIDFMQTVHGVKSFASLRSRATTVEIYGVKLLVADLPDIIKSKKAAGRPRDQSILSTLEETLREKQAIQQKGKARSPKKRK